jgi:hypothetical protein
MLDNFYVVEQALHQIEEDLPKVITANCPNWKYPKDPMYFRIGLGMGLI